MTAATASSTPRTLTVREAASAAGITEKAVRRRIERGTMRTVRGHDGRVRVLADDLAVVPGDAPVGHPDRAPLGQVPRGEAPQGNVSVADLLDRLTAQAEELGRLRALTASSEVVVEQERAEADRLRAEVVELRARVVELEAHGERRRGLRRLVPALARG